MIRGLSRNIRKRKGVREVETRITFEISGEQYTMFAEGFFKKKYYLLRKNRDSMFADNISVNVSVGTPIEAIKHRLTPKKIIGAIWLLSALMLIFLPVLYRCGGVTFLTALVAGTGSTALILVGIALLYSNDI